MTGRLYPDGTSVSNLYYRLDGQSYPSSSGGTNILDLTAAKDRTGSWPYSSYNAIRKLTSITNALTNVTTFVYCNCGSLEYVTNAANTSVQQVTHYVYDNKGNVTSIFYPDGSGRTNNYTYSAASDLLTLTDGKSQITRWNYDRYGRATNKVDAASMEIFRYQYDAGNRLTNRWSAAKGTTTYKYDRMANLTNVVYPFSPALTMKYDALSRLTNMVDAVGTTVYGYGNQFLASEDGPWDNDTLSYIYNNRLRSGLTLLQPNGTSWAQSYGYDSANHLQTISSPAGAFTYTFKGPGNLMSNLALPNAAAITSAFDSVGRLTGTWLKNSGGAILNSHAYAYSLAGQRTSVTNFAANYVNYTYDNRKGVLNIDTGLMVGTLGGCRASCESNIRGPSIT